MINYDMYNAFKGKRFHSSGNGRKSKDIGTFICRVGSAGFILIDNITTDSQTDTCLYLSLNGCFPINQTILEILNQEFVVTAVVFKKKYSMY